jgi:hypothetical protein
MTIALLHRLRVRLVAILAAALILSVTAALPAAGPVRAATQLRAVVIVGPVGSLSTGPSSAYVRDAEAVAKAAAAKGMAVTKLYPPEAGVPGVRDATWANVAAATAGANLVYFAGHGNGFPNPYISYLQPQVDDGYGLDPSANGNTPTYYGEQAVKSVKLAPGAVVLLNHLCYAPGASEPGNPIPAQATAINRVDNFAAGFLAAGAGAVFADDGSGMATLVNDLFSAPLTTTVDQLFASVDFHGHDIRAASVRTPGASLHLDPSRTGVYYDHAVAGRLTMTIDQWRNAQPRPRPPSCPTATAIPPINSSTTTFIPVAPTRILDTRVGIGLAGAFAAGVPRSLQVVGVDGIPTDALAVTINVTAVDETDGGYVAMTPTPAPCPATSTLNVPFGDTRANGATIPLSSSGQLNATYVGPYGDSTTDLIVDVTGYFVPSGGARYRPIAPARILDTRSNRGLTGSFEAGTARTLKIAGVGGVPANAVAVTVNLTVVDQTASGYVALTKLPSDGPSTSTLNVPIGDVRANGATVALNTDGTLSATFVARAGATADLILDLTGYFTPASGAAYHSVVPARVLDTRVGTGLAGTFTAHVARTLKVSGAVGVPTGAVSVTLNLTVVGQSAGGYVSITTKPANSPTTSTLNFPLGDTRANNVTIGLNSDGTVSLTYVARSGATTDLVIDITGYGA